MKSVIFFSIGIIGVVVFVSGFLLNNNLKKGELQATSLDAKKTSFAVVDGDSPPSCIWEVKTPQRVMAENKTQALVIETKNTAKKNCESYLSLRSPSFDMNPPKEEQKIALAPGEKGSIAWILTPRRTGTYDITVSDIINTKVFGITVTNMFGLSASQAKFLLQLSTFLGPMLTVPWWWDRWRQRKPKQEVKKEEVKQE